MKGAKRQIQQIHKSIKELHRELLSLGLSGKIVQPDHDAMQLQRLLRLEQALSDSAHLRRQYLLMPVAPRSALARQAARIRAADEVIIDTIMDFNSDLRRGEKCVSLRHTARPVSVTTGPGAAVHSKRRREDK